jgi:hypothetical protein
VVAEGPARVVTVTAVAMARRGEGGAAVPARHLAWQQRQLSGNDNK